jgi:ribose transport system permease protein
MSGSQNTFARFQSLLALLLMVIGLSLATDNFLTVDNGMNVLRQISINLCLSIGMTLVILSGGIDLSVGSVLALAGALAAGVLKNGLTLDRLGVWVQFTPFGAVLVGVAVGLAAGCFNGLAITRFGLPPFVATLGMLSIARGFTMLWTGGFPITGLGPAFGSLGTGQWLGVPMPVWISAALALVFLR